MPSFSDSFWSAGYAPGLTTLFNKLHQGCGENDEVLALAAARADAEEQYGAKLQEIKHSFGPKKAGFGRDDGASLRRAYEGIVSEMSEQGKHHTQVAENIRRMVAVPFGKWADEHRQRVDYSHSVLKGKLKAYDKELAEVQRSQKRYFNKCRLLEDYKDSEEGEAASTHGTQANTAANAATQAGTAAAASIVGDLHEPSPASHSSGQSVGPSHGPHGAQAAPASNAAPAPGVPGSPRSDDPEFDILSDPVELGEKIYSPDEAAILFQRFLDEIPQKSVKVAILGTYDHVSTGDEIVTWVQQHLADGSVAQSEAIGQNLINSGYLRLVGQVGSKFANSSVMNYQWRKKAFVQAGRMPAESRDLVAPFGGYLGDTINSYIQSTAHPDETVEQRLNREVKESDGRYRLSVEKLDDIRCNLEESIVDHVKFMERCEFDRLKALKAVFLDFLASLSNVVPSIQAAIDKQLLFQEAVHPANDLRYILEAYRTGPFTPKVTVYDNYYNSTEGQTFGVDLELRARGDHKRVPQVVSAILTHMDSQYPDLEDDQVRLGTWTVSVPLNSTHRLRKALNTAASATDSNSAGTKPFPRELLREFEPPIVASALKLYFVELPDSVVPSQFYDIVKAIYVQHGSDDDPRARISAIQNTLAQLRVANIATLDAVCTHLTRLISITEASPEYVSQLSQELSHCILRPRAQSSLTLGDRHAYRLVHDLLVYKDSIFGELKRHNSGNSSLSSRSGSARHRNVSGSSSSSAADNVRRPSLQRRLDALSLKIRQSNPPGRRERSVKEEPEERELVPELGPEPEREQELRNGQTHSQNGENGQDDGTGERDPQPGNSPGVAKIAEVAQTVPTQAAEVRQASGHIENPIVVD